MSMKTEVVVHKDGEEGVLVVDRMTGAIKTPGDERPAWAEGLASAALQERLSWYRKRLGDGEVYSLIANAAAIEMVDLVWVGIDAEQQEVEIEANLDYRGEVVAKALGISTAVEEGHTEMTTEERFGEVVGEVDIERTNTVRSEEDQRVLAEAIDQGFPATATEADTKTGTA